MTTVHQGQPVLSVGKPLTEAKAAMILVHGRGASAQSILQLADAFGQSDWSYVAPQAYQSTWYPYSFLAPIEQNEPALSSALQTLDDLVNHVLAQGILAGRLVIGGFSQGACLSLEYVARHPRRYGGVFAFSGGLIGPDGTPRDYVGELNDVPMFLGCSDVDFHIPLSRVKESTQVLGNMGATVDERIYAGMGHIINDDEIQAVKSIMESIALD